jgi:predicted  nucleic acid-binding Zn-ribbon protein
LSRDDFYIPTDVDALRMENELLTFEVRFLKAQLSARETAAERSAAQLQSRLEEAERRLGESEHSTAQLRTRLEEAERAEQDLVLLLRRLANSPLGWLLRLKQNFRILEQRYLGNDA